MKKFLVLGLVLFGFSTLFAKGEGSKMDYYDAFDYCKGMGKQLASTSSLQSWAGDYNGYWAKEGVVVFPDSGKVLSFGIMKNDKYYVRCE